MPTDPQGFHLLIELWHLGLGLLGLLTAWIAYDRHYLAPLRKWRGEMDIWKAETNKDLERGKNKMDNTDRLYACLDQKMDKVLQRLTAIETLMRHTGGLPPEA